MLMTILATAVTGSATYSVSLIPLLGYALLTVGILATALSTQRYLLGYAIAGMLYWLVVEALQSAVITLLPLSIWHSYVAALVLSWGLISVSGVWLWRRGAALGTSAFDISSTHISSTHMPATRRSHAPVMDDSRYIEHTPVYINYRPKFQ